MYSLPCCTPQLQTEAPAAHGPKSVRDPVAVHSAQRPAQSAGLSSAWQRQLGAPAAATAATGAL
eukprot:COSAG03_NODE_226_length_10318_cov_14.007925_4_plen_64_part_00